MEHDEDLRKKIKKISKHANKYEKVFNSVILRWVKFNYYKNTYFGWLD